MNNTSNLIIAAIIMGAFVGCKERYIGPGGQPASETGQIDKDKEREYIEGENRVKALINGLR